MIFESQMHCQADDCNFFDHQSVSDDRSSERTERMTAYGQATNFGHSRFISAGISRNSTSMLTSTREFAQDELLDETAGDVQHHVYAKGLEYMAGRTRRTGVVSGRNGISN